MTAASADQVTTPKLRQAYEQNIPFWAGLHVDSVFYGNEAQRRIAAMEHVIGQLSADRHPSSTIAAAADILDKLRATGKALTDLNTATEQVKAAFEHGIRDLESARAMEEAHTSLPGGPAKNTDAYAAQ